MVCRKYGLFHDIIRKIHTGYLRLLPLSIFTICQAGVNSVGILELTFMSIASRLVLIIMPPSTSQPETETACDRKDRVILEGCYRCYVTMFDT